VAGFVGTSNIFDGDTAVSVTGSPQAFSVRPEKIRLAEMDAEVTGDMCCVDGQVKEVVYLGIHTRYTVLLETGVEMLVVEQNLDVTSRDVTAVLGKSVRLIWPRAVNNHLDDGA
jgi:putative spermidine/putrescine transport system ATP-binding protein